MFFSSGDSKITVKLVKFKLPSDELREKYEAKKAEYMDKKFREFQEELNLIDSSNMVMKNGRPALTVKCDECEYEWNYTGERKVAQCPNCNHRIYIAEVEEDEDKGVELRCRHCEYEWKYTGGAKQTRCPDCGGYVNTKTDRI